MQSNMVHVFSRVPHADIQRSQFNRSHSLKTTFDAGDLIPIYVDEALPGDTFNLKMTAFARMNTPIKPLMDNLFLDTFFFAVPCRLVWDNWQKFMGEQKNPGDSVDYLVPIMTAPAGGYLTNSLHDYLGLPVGVAGITNSSLFHRAYNLIWNEWFRDQNLQNSAVVDLDDGPDTPGDYVVKKRGKRHDYFTSALPWPQKGTAVTIPLGTSAPVYGTGKALGLWDGTTARGLGANGSGTLEQYSGNYNANVGVANSGTGIANKALGVVTKTAGSPAGISGLEADLSTATAATINALRTAFQIQKLYERDARGGTRYTEIIRAHFGVISPDARLQRPEFLGGGSSAVVINPVVQNSSTDATTPQGNLAGYGVVGASGHGFTKSFTEHCLLIGLACVRADLNYQQGIDRMFSRRTKLDFYWPALSHLGEQAILNKEIYAQGTTADNNVFGYQERFAEYRYHNSKITGQFRTDTTGVFGSYDIWHLAQNFGSLPTLSDTFIQENPPMDRVVAVNTEPDFLFDSYFNVKCARPMPTYSVPGLIDHF